MHTKSYFAVAIALLASISVSAIDKKAIQDTLNTIAARHAYVGTIKVTQLKQRGANLDVYASAQLSCLSLSPELVDSLKDATQAAAGVKGKVRIYSDGHELSELITSIHGGKNTSKKHRLPEVEPMVRNVSQPYSSPKGLDGRHIALYGSHGIYYYQTDDRWIWQRAKMFTTVEDLYTTTYTMPFLVPMLENAGAVVIQARERDRQIHEVIVDDQQANHGQWINVVDGGWGPLPGDTLGGQDNPFTFGGYAYQSCSKDEKSLRYTPSLPEAGQYGVYVSYKTVEKSTDKAQYIVVHKGIRTEFEVNQQMAGGTWVWLSQFDFGTNPNENYVEVLANGKNGEVVTSDAIRFGGGIGNISRHGNTSGIPRWIEGARCWFQYSGIPDSVYNYTNGKNDYTDDYASRGRWMNWLIGGSAAYPQGPGLNVPVELGLAFHTDAGTTPDNTNIGTLMIYTEYDDEKKYNYPDGSSRMLARDYGDYMQTQLVNDVQATYAPEWHRRQLLNSSYSESRNPKFPVVLLEFLSHQNFADMKYGLDPSFRFIVSRAIYKGMLRFLHEQYGTPYVVQPLPVQDFAIRFGEGNKVQLRWQPRADLLEETATPNAYIVYTREEGKDWDNGTVTKTNSYTVSLQTDKQYDFKVCAINDGGRSFPSEVLTARKASNEKGKVLIINGFTRVSGPDHFESRDSLFAGFKSGHYAVDYMNNVGYIGEQFEFERSLQWQSDDNCGFGTCYNDGRNISPIGNTFDYPVMHGKVLSKADYSYVSCSASSIEEIGDEWTFVDLILGKQKQIQIGNVVVQTKYPLFPSNLRSALERYHGHLLVSGCYIGSEMASKEDKAWTQRVLHYSFSADHASHNGSVHTRGSLGKHDLQLVTTLNEKTLPSETPDGIRPYGDKAECVARYADSTIGAGVAYSNQYKQLIFSFALESLNDFDAFYTKLIDYLK